MPRSRSRSPCVDARRHTDKQTDKQLFLQSNENKMTSKIVFKINGKQYEANGKFGPDVSLNEYIRTIADLRGTKAMCHEGGCGACIVSVRAATPPTDEMKTFAVNSCLVSILSCHGWEITTVEGIGNRNKGYHDIQTRLAKFNGTQCGYCTPGWIMNMYSLHTAKKGKLTTTEIENSFAGNICRCTGYRSIADAFKTFATDTDKNLTNKLTDLEDLGMFKPCGVSCNKKCAHKNKDNDVLLGKLNFEEVKEKPDDDWCIVEKANKELITLEYGAQKWYKAYSLEHVFEIMAMCKEYKLIAGNTGQGVYHVEKYPSNVIDIFNVAEIKGYIMDVNLVLGAGMTLTDMMEVFVLMAAQNEDFAYLKQFHEHMDLVAHVPVRNIGTIGGNLYMKYVNTDFQSDLFLLFETVGAIITIAEGAHKTKAVSLPAFLKLSMKRKIILNIMLPPLSKWCSVKTYKIMPRSQNAHAVVNAGFLFKFKHDSTIIEKCTLVFGSISPSFIHAEKTESALVGKELFSDETVQIAVKSLFEEVKPEEAPPEPGVDYRRMLAVTLFYKALLYLCPDGKLDPRYRSGGAAIKRNTSNGTQTFDTDKSIWPLNQPIPKIEALVQCSGEATFANDLQSVIDEVHGAFVCADAKPGSIISGFDTTEAMKLPGVIAFYTAQDIPGVNTFTTLNVPLVVDEEEILCSKEVKFYGQPAAIIVAKREKTANRAAKLVKVKYASISARLPILTVKDVLKSPEKSKRLKNNKTVEPVNTGHDVHLVLKGELNLETQYHYYMEPQTCVVRPTEDGMEVYSATQWLDLTNVAVAQCLKMPANSVNVIVRRVGGSYGGKISRSVQIACAAALVSHLQNKTCRFVVPLQTNVKIAGKRIPTYSNFDVGVNKDGVIQYLKNIFYQDNGCSENETISPVTVNHFINCYDSKRWYIEANSVATDTPSNTWCRAPSSTEGVAMIENIMEQIAHNLNKDPLEVRLNNMDKKDNPVPDLIEQLKKDSDFENRYKEVDEFNKNNRWRKRALNLLPMAYDLFYIGNFNSIVSVLHSDGSVVITHGGIEMGQGINTKVAQVAAYMLGVALEKVSIKSSTSFTSPNSMTTGASIGSECVAFATVKACEILLKRLEPIQAKMGKPSWEELVEKAFKAGIDLQASHMYSSNDGVKPYFIYGVVALELEVDILTGNHDVRRVDLLEDTGRSLSPEIDIGQIEGAFIMGLGYFTSEKTIYNPATGQLLTDRTWNYKPPGIKDIPADFRVYFKRNGTNKFGVLQSKATGEPSLCLSSVVVHALRQAVRSARLEAGHKDDWIEMGLPCTVENIFTAVGHKLEDFKLK
ncbi:indole-3-acetaldehyde oxidase-like [Leguminivora glycinivorella]|uniref:indole-3-acetaldehyde oxidase-like n=1 Tax=Leguminivora glycinivorella TaxID=1035111 RepID=UPI00200EE6C9|nr:indole-3-acetaldehyde oxidase-like [Leguminivora glycinivorella]